MSQIVNGLSSVYLDKVTGVDVRGVYRPLNINRLYSRN